MRKLVFVFCVAFVAVALFHRLVPAKIQPAERTLAVRRLAGSQAVREQFQVDAAPYLALYHGASWCGPCQAFSPTLAAFYQHADKSRHWFQLVMINYDNSEDEMIGYMRQHHMAFPAVLREDADGWSHATGNGIPNLIVIETATGKILASSYDGSDYVGCGPPLALLQRIAAQGHP